MLEILRNIEEELLTGRNIKERLINDENIDIISIHNIDNSELSNIKKIQNIISKIIYKKSIIEDKDKLIIILFTSNNIANSINKLVYKYQMIEIYKNLESYKKELVNTKNKKQDYLNINSTIVFYYPEEDNNDISLIYTIKIKK